MDLLASLPGSSPSFFSYYVQKKKGWAEETGDEAMELPLSTFVTEHCNCQIN